MRFEFIEAEKANHRVPRLCRVLQVSRSGFYAWRKRGLSNRARRDRALKVKILVAHRESQGAAGSPQVYRALLNEGERVGRKRVARLMREDGLQGFPKKRFKVTTNSNHKEPVAPNLLLDRPPITGPNQVWVGDITYIRTWEGWLYLAVLIDLFSRRVVGWATATHMRAELPIDALQMAIGQRRPLEGLICHSDRGSQYASRAYREILEQHGMRQSMSRKGNVFDNAWAESFFGTLKQALIHRHPWPTTRAAAEAVRMWIGTYYNAKRLHSAIGYMSPMAFEQAGQEVRLAA